MEFEVLDKSITFEITMQEIDIDNMLAILRDVKIGGIEYNEEQLEVINSFETFYNKLLHSLSPKPDEGLKEVIEELQKKMQPEEEISSLPKVVFSEVPGGFDSKDFDV